MINVCCWLIGLTYIVVVFLFLLILFFICKFCFSDHPQKLQRRGWLPPKINKNGRTTSNHTSHTPSTTTNQSTTNSGSRDCTTSLHSLHFHPDSLITMCNSILEENSSEILRLYHIYTHVDLPHLLYSSLQSLVSISPHDSPMDHLLRRNNLAL